MNLYARAVLQDFLELEKVLYKHYPPPTGMCVYPDGRVEFAVCPVNKDIHKLISNVRNHLITESMYNV